MVAPCIFVPIVVISNLLLFVVILASVQLVVTCIPLTELLLCLLRLLMYNIGIVFLPLMILCGLFFLKTVLFLTAFFRQSTA